LKRAIIRMRPVGSLSTGEWEAYHALRIRLRAKYHPQAAAEAPKRTSEAFRERTLASLETLGGVEHVLFKEPDGIALAWMRFFKQGSQLSVGADFDADVIPRGFLGLLQKGMQVEMDRHDLDLAMAWVEEERLRIGFESLRPLHQIPYVQMVFERDQLEPLRVTNWRQMLDALPSHYRMVHVQDYPAHIHGDYLRLHRQFSEELPLVGVTLPETGLDSAQLDVFREVQARNGQTSRMAFLEHEDGTRLGLCEMVASMENGNAIQGMTGINPLHRGQGLAKALKVYLMLKTFEDIPSLKRIATTVSPINPSMLGLNEHLGFKQIKETTQFFFSRED